MDITTGEFAATELSGEDLPALAARRTDPPATGRNPACPKAASADADIRRHSPAGRPGVSKPGRCQETLLDHFQVAALDGFGLRGLTLAVRAAGAICQYLQETQPAALKLLTSLATYA